MQVVIRLKFSLVCTIFIYCGGFNKNYVVKINLYKRFIWSNSYNFDNNQIRLYENSAIPEGKKLRVLQLF